MTRALAVTETAKPENSAMSYWMDPIELPPGRRRQRPWVIFIYGPILAL